MTRLSDSALTSPADRVHHTGDEQLTRHALNAQTREVRGGYRLAKPGATPADKIDAAVASVLAWEARADVIASGEGSPGRAPHVLGE